MQNPNMQRKPSGEQRNVFDRNYENKAKQIRAKRSRHFETYAQYLIRLEHFKEGTKPISYPAFAFPTPDNDDVIELPF